MEKDIRLYSEWLGCEVIELSVQVDHVQVVVSIPPKGISVHLYGYHKRQDGYKSVQELSDVKEATLLG